MWVAKQKLCSVTNDSSIAQSKLSISKEPPTQTCKNQQRKATPAVWCLMPNFEVSFPCHFELEL